MKHWTPLKKVELYCALEKTMCYNILWTYKGKIYIQIDILNICMYIYIIYIYVSKINTCTNLDLWWSFMLTSLKKRPGDVCCAFSFGSLGEIGGRCGRNPPISHLLMCQKEIREIHQLKLAVYPITFQVLYNQKGGWEWNFWSINYVWKVGDLKSDLSYPLPFFRGCLSWSFQGYPVFRVNLEGKNSWDSIWIDSLPDGLMAWHGMGWDGLMAGMDWWHEWMNGWMNEWTNEWMNEWMNE